MVLKGILSLNEFISLLCCAMRTMSISSMSLWIISVMFSSDNLQCSEFLELFVPCHVN